jgi:hypothetical protein
MSNPIDATLANFISQTVREAMAEERRLSSRERNDKLRERRRINSERQPTVAFGSRDERQPTVAFGQSQPIRTTSNCPFGAIASNKLSQERPNPFTWGCSFTQPTTLDTNTKKVRISDPPINESRYSFARPQTQSMVASAVSTPPTTSNSVTNSVFDIPNKNDSFNLIFGADNILKQNKGMQINEYNTSVTPKTRPPQPNYPPPVYSGSSDMPELISDSEDEEAPTSSLASLQKAFDAQVPETITNILSSLLGVDTKELEGLADELLGTKKSGVTNTEKSKLTKPTMVTPDVKNPTPSPVPHSVFSNAYRAFVTYLFNEVKVSPSVKIIIEEHLTNLVRDRFNDVNTSQSSYPYYTKYTNYWQDTTTRVVKAICIELSCSHRLSALEDMIKNIAIEDLHKFKDFKNEIKF